MPLGDQASSFLSLGQEQVQPLGATLCNCKNLLVPKMHLQLTVRRPWGPVGCSWVSPFFLVWLWVLVGSTSPFPIFVNLNKTT